MTLDEAIKHWEEKTEALYKAIPCDGCVFNECANEHRQLAEWLKDYKRLLEQEPCENAISRQSVLDATVKKNSIWNSITNSKGENLEEIISQLPPVTPQQKTGHWISFGVQGEVDGQIVQVFTCSECGAISIFRMASGNIVNGDICPNCGAKMKSETEQGLSYADQDTLMSAT